MNNQVLINTNDLFIMHTKYDRIGKDYNKTRKADPYLAGRLFHFLNPTKNDLYLDIGCGTGNYTNELNKMGAKFIGVDPSEEMLSKARKNNTFINWVKGEAEDLPLETGSVAGVVASLTVHHWNSLNAGFKELNRVLLPHGNVVIFTSTPAQMKDYWLNFYFPTIMEKSIRQMPSFEMLEENIIKNGFNTVGTEKYYIQDDLQDMFLYSGKHRPALYFNENIRQGISSFSSLANKEEVESGLKILKDDFVSGKIDEVINDYDNDKGDYLFIVAKKIN